MNERMEELMKKFTVELSSLVREEAHAEIKGRLVAAMDLPANGHGPANGNGHTNGDLRGLRMPAMPAMVKRPRGMQAKRTPEEIATAQVVILDVLGKSKEPLSAEQIQGRTGLNKDKLPLPLRRLINARQVKFTGVARGRKYTR